MRGAVTRTSRVRLDERLSRGCTVWFTGLSGSGKTTVAVRAEEILIGAGRPAYVLDGDDLRSGLNADLGFAMADRTENLRRIAHLALMMAEAGLVALVPVISPMHEHREVARQLHEDAGIDFLEVHVDTPLAICERRDTKGLYARARAGEIIDLTGIGSPYEAPDRPDLRLAPPSDVDTHVAELLAVLGAARLQRSAG